MSANGLKIMSLIAFAMAIYALLWAEKPEAGLAALVLSSFYSITGEILAKLERMDGGK